MKAPSKKIVFTLLACLIAVFGIYFALHPQLFRKSAQKSTADAIIQAIAATKSNVDSDNDGLPDWEETLYGTDPHNPDSDGDGTSDGDEVKEGRDPLKANTAKKGETANDLMASSTVSAALANSASSSPDLTSTDLFARQFFANYLQLKSQGITMDAASEQQVIDQTLASGNFPIPQPVVYTTGEINAVPQNDPATLKQYGNAMGASMVTHSQKGNHDNEYEIFNKALTNQDQSEIAKMDPIINDYKDILADYMKMPVPSGAVQIHLAIINSLSAILTDLKAMRGVFDDPIAAEARLSKFYNDTLAMKAAFESLLPYFNKNGVIFTSSDIGSVVVHDI